MQTPLLLGRGAGQEEEQVVHAAEMDCPKKPVMDAGIIIDPLSQCRGRKDTLSSMTAPKVPNAEDRKPGSGKFTLKSTRTQEPPDPHLLLLKVSWDMENISDQQQDPFNQQVVFFLPILPVLGKKRKKNKNGTHRHINIH